MSKQVVLFPGQGSQFDEMGVDWCRDFLAARLVYQEASDLLGLDVLKLSGEGAPFHRSTHKSQLAVLTHSIAIWRVLCHQGIIEEPICAGMSLGEFSALIAAKKAEFCEIIPLIEQRAHLMEQICRDSNSGMAAVLGIAVEQVQEILEDEKCNKQVWIANFNAPTQTVISGSDEGLSRASQALFDAGGRVQRLNVAGAFHTPLMKSAQKRWFVQWQRLLLKVSPVELISSISGEKEGDVLRLHALIGQQMTQPVLWTAAARKAQGEKPVLTFEVGSRVLKSLQRRIDQTVDVVAIQSVRDLAQMTKSKSNFN